MEINENSVLILDTKNDYDQAFFNHDDLRIIGIEKNCEKSLNTIENVESEKECLEKLISAGVNGDRKSVV